MDKQTLKNIKKCIGQTIKQIVVHDSIVTIDFYTKKDYQFRLILKDQETICCERRYYSCDDDLNVDGSILIAIELEDGRDSEKDGYEHEEKFLKIKTNKETITVCSHNIHNGYYGGISLETFLYKGKVVPAK